VLARIAGASVTSPYENRPRDLRRDAGGGDAEFKWKNSCMTVFCPTRGEARAVKLDEAAVSQAVAAVKAPVRRQGQSGSRFLSGLQPR